MKLLKGQGNDGWYLIILCHENATLHDLVIGIIHFKLLLLRHHDTTFDSLMIHLYHIPTKGFYIYDHEFLYEWIC